MSRAINSFAVLDDSDDEQPQVKATSNNKNSASSAGAGGDVAKQSQQSVSDHDSKSRRNPNNDRNTKGGRGPRRARDGKRTYDRRSGTGRGKEIKKGGGGARNWGSDKVDAKKAEGDVDEQELNKEVEGQGGEGGGGEEVAEVPAATPEPVIEEEEEDKTLTLEEYMASKKKTVSVFGSMTKGEKVIENEFEGKNARVAVEEDFLEKTGGKALRKKGSSAKDKGVEKLDLNFRIKKASGGDGDRDDRPRRTGGGRGGGEGGGAGGDRRRGGGDRRSGGRGRGGRGGGGGGGGRRGGGRGGNFALDTNAFPSL